MRRIWDPVYEEDKREANDSIHLDLPPCGGIATRWDIWMGRCWKLMERKYGSVT
jgi:hypothetical protein